MANTFRQDSYRPAKTIGYVAIAILAAIAVCSLLYVLFSIGMIAFPDVGIDIGDGESINAPLMAMGLIALLELPLRIACVVLFLVWLHRAYSNLIPLKAQNLEFTPAWAVGWWFIPFLNLVRPFQVVRELYNESDPAVDPETGYSYVPGGTPMIVGLWWVTFVLAGISHRIGDALYGSGDLPSSEYFPLALLVAGALSAVSAVAAILVVSGVNKRQDERASKLATYIGVSDLPPAPPTFGHQG